MRGDEAAVLAWASEAIASIREVEFETDMEKTLGSLKDAQRHIKKAKKELDSD